MDQTADQAPVGAGPTPIMVTYASALDAGDAGLAAGLFAENALLTSADERLRAAPGSPAGTKISSRGAGHGHPSSQGNDAGRLEVDGPTGGYVVELAFDASGRIGTARWLTPGRGHPQPQEERERSAT